MMLQPAVLRRGRRPAPIDAIGPDDGSRADLRAGIDDRGRMNLHVAHLSRNVNINSPSETTASFTTQ